MLRSDKWSRRNTFTRNVAAVNSIKVQQGRPDVYYAIGDILSLCLRYRSIATKVQQSSVGVYYAIGDILILCLHAVMRRLRARSSLVNECQASEQRAQEHLRIPAYTIVHYSTESSGASLSTRIL